MRRRVEIRKVRKPHVCDACGGIIKKGDYAFVETVLYPAYNVNYYHYTEGISLEDFKKMSWDEIRGRICSVKEKQNIERMR